MYPGAVSCIFYGAMSAKLRDIKGLISPSIRRLEAYHVDDSAVRVKLDAMENPFTLPEDLRTEIGLACRNAKINRYPDPSAGRLKLKIAEYWGMEPNSMLLGNGSDELIQMLILAFGGPVVTPVPSFAMYEITAKALSQKVVPVPLDKDFALDPDRLLKSAGRARARVIFLACPNNPTGNRFSDESIRMILERVSAAVVIDEAYYSFSGKTWLPSLRDYPNLLILRTLSKIGLAGLRVGVLTASRKVIEELNKVRLPYNINVLSQIVAEISLSRREAIDRQISMLISERGRLYNELTKIEGVRPYPSETNFILFRTKTSAARIHEGLKHRGILIKNLDRPGPLKNCLRVSIGTPEENNEFVAGLRELSAGN